MEHLIYNHAISNKIQFPVCTGYTTAMENSSTHISYSTAKGIDLFLNVSVKLISTLTK